MIVKIVQLPPLRVISFRSAFPESPESDAFQKLSYFLNQHGLENNPTCYQVFGRNNPISLSNPHNRGYEFLLTVPDNFHTDPEYDEFILRENLYAVVASKGIMQMQENWPNIIEWIKQSSGYTFGYPGDYDYENSPSLELEHHITPLNSDINTMLIDYYFPIKKKN